MNADRKAPARCDLPPSRRPGDPPGMAAIRRFFGHPVFRGIRAWLRLIGDGIHAAWKWLDKNAGPIARGIERAGDIAGRASQGAVRVGQAAGEIGGKLGEWGRERRGGGGAKLRRIGGRMRDFGRRATRLGTGAEDVAESVEDLGKGLASLVEDGGKPERRAPRLPAPTPAREPRAEARPHRRLPRSASVSRAPSPAISEPAAAERAAPDGELPEVFHERIRALGKRKRSKPLRALILDICAVREWTTVGELSGWLRMDHSNLQKRHLRPLVRAGRLRLRYPDNPRHPDQAYGAVT